MNKIVLVIVAVMFAANVALAAETETLKANIVLSKDLGSAQCTPDKGKGAPTIIWNGVRDERSTKTVGVLKKRNDEFDVVAAEPVEKLLEQGMKTVLGKCGFNVSSAAEAKGVKMSVDLKEFFAGSKKGFIMGETEAKGQLTVRLLGSTQSFDLDYSATKEDKGLKKKNITKLESALSEVMAMMITKVVATNQLGEALKELGK